MVESTSEQITEEVFAHLELKTFDRVLLSVVKGFPLEVQYQVEHGFHSPWHEGFFCPSCGEIWARIFYFGCANGWILHDNWCFDCREQALAAKPHKYGLMPGGVVHWFDDTDWKNFPFAVLKRELMIWTPALGSDEWGVFFRKATDEAKCDVNKLIMEIHGK